MRLEPCARLAIATARIVCDFEPGIVTSPQSRDFLQMNFIGQPLHGVFVVTSGPIQPPSLPGGVSELLLWLEIASHRESPEQTNLLVSSGMIMGQGAHACVVLPVPLCRGKQSSVQCVYADLRVPRCVPAVRLHLAERNRVAPRKSTLHAAAAMAFVAARRVDEKTAG